MATDGSKRVAVVGGTGNISGALVDARAAAGHDVTFFVRGQRVPAALPPVQPRWTLAERIAENIAAIEAHPHPDLPRREEVPDREDEVIGQLGLAVSGSGR
jgi:nucleoside-diphosphate-sugar epimerase